MKKIMTILKKNLIFVIIAAAVLLAAYVVSNRSVFSSDIFSADYLLANSVQAYVTSQGGAFVIDSSNTIAVADADDTLLYTIEGNKPESTFERADEILLGNDGALYVLDSISSDDGVEVEGQRILRFTHNGTRREVLYKYIADEDAPVMLLSSIAFNQGKLCFSCVSQDAVSVYSIDDPETPLCVMEYEDAAYMIMDTAFSPDLHIAVCLRNGDICVSDGGEVTTVFSAREHDNENYPSIVTDVCFGGNDSLYYLDTGQRYIGRIRNGETEIVANSMFIDGTEAESFAASELYSSLTVSGEYLTTLSASYDVDAEDYSYHLCSLDNTGRGGTDVENATLNPMIRRNMLHTTVVYHVREVLVCIAALLLTGILIYSLVMIVKFIIRTDFGNNRTQLLILITALAVAIGTTAVIFDKLNERYSEENSRNLSNIAELVEKSVDKELIKELDSPEDYMGDAFCELESSLFTILHNDINNDSDLYVVVYRVYNDILCEVYRDDYVHGVMHPMAGVFSGSIEEDLAKTGGVYKSQNYTLSEGSYNFALVPTYDENGDILAFYEIGTDNNRATAMNQKLYKRVLILAVMVVIIVMLMFTEISNAFKAFRARHEAQKHKTVLPPEVLRPLIFMIFFTCNITTAFLPIYSSSLWNESFPLPMEVGAALPLSMEMLVSSISALLCSSFIKRRGILFPLILGGLCYVGGNILSVFAGNLWVLILANSTCGFGGGMLTVGVSSWIAGFETEEMTNRGFVHYNAGYLAGMNCGTVIGSLLWENFSIKTAYFSAAGSAVVIVALVILIARNVKLHDEGSESKNTKVSIKQFFSRRVISYFLFFTFPYLVCAAFLLYYFPIVAEEHALSASEISLAFLVSGVISIYAGTTIGEPLIDTIGSRRAMVLAGFIYIIALFYAALTPGVFSCYVVIVLFAIADSFGLAAQAVYYAGLDEVKAIGESRAQGISSTAESTITAAGSLIFGSILLLGDRLGLMVLAVTFAVLMILFTLGGGKHAEHTASNDSGSAETA